jgi:hypothetical protein
MTSRSGVVASATLLAALPWAVAAAGAVYAYYLEPGAQQKTVLLGSIFLGFWIAVASFCTAVVTCVDAPRKRPWALSAAAGFCYMLAYAAIQGLR